MKDLLAPEPKRVRRHLSAVINFAKFREERLVMYAELAVKVRLVLLFVGCSIGKIGGC
jgi:hypothetical protein